MFFFEVSFQWLTGNSICLYQEFLWVLKMKLLNQGASKLGLYAGRKLTVNKATTGSRREKILGLEKSEDRFTKIYSSNHWNSSESRSGEGSTLENTQNLRAELPRILDRYEIKKMLDAPCGDFNWMQHVTKNTFIKYIGGDIVKPLIKFNQSEYGDKDTTFIHLDLTKNTLPKVDLLFCRDCLFHLSYKDISLVLNNFLGSSIPYLMTTSSAAPNGSRIENSDIATSDWRLIDFFTEPFSLSQCDVLESISDEMVSVKAERSLILLNRATVQGIFKNLTTNIEATG
jgi:hypothetical protein